MEKGKQQRKQQQSQVISVPAPQNLHLEKNNSPLTFIDGWDFSLVFLAATVRLFMVMKYKSLDLKEKGEEFKINKYFNQRHLIRWGGHYFTAMVLLLVLPEIFGAVLGPKYFPEFSDWSFTADFIIGFLGYDLIKALESASLPLIKKHLKINLK